MVQRKESGIVTFAPNDKKEGLYVTKILLCDDDPLFLEMLQTQLREMLKKNGAIFSFSEPSDIPKDLLSECDIFFLDVDFTGKNFTGLNVAQKIRSVNPKGVILFLTNYIQYAPAGYEVRAFRYLMKSEIHEKLEPALRDALEQVAKRPETIQLTVSGEMATFFIADILYIESLGHAALLHTTGKTAGEFRLYSTLTRLEQQLAPKGFLRIQKSFLVNMRRITRFRCDQVTLDNELTLPVSEKMYRDLKKKYLAWRGQE